MTNLDSIWQSRDITLPTKIHVAKSVVFPVVMYSCESWTTKKDECRRHQPWTFIGRTDAEAEAPILWPPEVKSQLIGKDSDARKDWRQEEKVTTEDDMVGWHRQLNRHEFEKTPGDGKGQRSLECWVHGVAKRRTSLSNNNKLTKEQGCNSSLELWRIHFDIWQN